MKKINIGVLYLLTFVIFSIIYAFFWHFESLLNYFSTFIESQFASIQIAIGIILVFTIFVFVYFKD